MKIGSSPVAPGETAGHPLRSSRDRRAALRDADAADGATRVLVVGLGNSLMGDDGAGPAAIAELRRHAPYASVRLEDGGCDSLALPGLWGGEPEIWIIDAVQGGLPPGALHRLDHRELLELPEPTTSAHHLCLSESLRWVRLAFPLMAEVRYRLWGIEPERLGPHEGLSPAVLGSVGRVVAEVLQALANRSNRCD